MKPTLASAGNTVVPAYLALLQRGLSVSCTGAYWMAEGPDHRFVAEDPLLLLALVALHETRGSEWQASDEEIDRFITDFGE
jgi:hypothetical protein